MAIKVIAQLRDVKLGKNPGKKFVMRPDLYVPITEKKVFQEAATHSGISAGVIDQGGLGCCWRSDPHLGDRRSLYPTPRTWHDALRCSLEGCGEAGGREGKPDQCAPYHLHPERGCEGRVEEHFDSDHLSRRGWQRAKACDQRRQR